MKPYFSAKELLSPPASRPAFSDRQAYVCAEMSRLAYFKFEGGSMLEQALAVAKDILKDDSRLTALELQLQGILTASPAAAAESDKAFKTVLTECGFEDAKTYSEEGTQAFICTMSASAPDGGSKKVAFVAFRGTEPKDFRDIKTDIKASLVPEKVGDDEILVHSGFINALKLVDGEIKNDLETLKPDQVYVTGHSLGGALAILFTRIHYPSENGACYTYGAPAVGAVELQYKLKTPVYEIINELDIVPRLLNPFVGKFLGALIQFVRLASRLVTGPARFLASVSWDEKLEDYFDMLTKYRHPGYLSYLVGSSKAARLRFNLNLFDKIRLWFTGGRLRFSRLKNLVNDHNIDLYVGKLIEHARKRN